MGISFQELYKINGVIDTARPVMQNIEMLTSSCASWLAYDVSTGKWSLVLNKAGNSSFAFDDSNIIGNIDVSGTGMDGLYNSVEIEYPNNDLLDSSDFVRLDLSSGQRKTNEPDLTLSLNYPLINDPIMASALGSLELNQSRLIDTTITFSADYTATTVKGGDIVSVTNTAYDYTNKLFRVLKTEQVNNTNDGITIKITAMEYDPAVYTNALIRDTRSPVTNVRSIGAIGKMTKPVAYRVGGVPITEATPTLPETTIARQPHIRITSSIDSSVPAGLIEGIEIWIYKIPDSELEYPGDNTLWEADDDDLRDYELHTTLRPDPGGSYSASDTIDYEIMENISNKTGYEGSDWGNLLVKLRCVNSVTAGEYSPHSNLIKWKPRIEADGLTDAVIFPPDVPVVLSSGYEVVDNLTAGANWQLMFTSPTFSPEADAVCTVISILDQNTSGALGGRGDFMNSTYGFDEPEDSVAVAFDVLATNAGELTLSSSVTAVKGQTVVQANSGASTTVKVSSTGTSLIVASTSGFTTNTADVLTINSVATTAYPTAIAANQLVASPASGGPGAFYWTDFACAGEGSFYADTTYKIEFLHKTTTESNPTAGVSYDIAWTLSQNRAIT